MHFFVFNLCVASFAVVPGAASATSIAAGVIYGTPLGLSLVAVSCAAGAGVSFVIARYAARPIVEKLFIKDGSRFAALDQAVMRDGAQIVLLARLSPFSPYVAMSFLFGLTAVEFWPYLGASAVGILPASFVYVYMGDTGRRASNAGAHTSNVEMAFYAFGLLMTVLVTYRIATIAQETLGNKVGLGVGGGGGGGWCCGICGGSGGGSASEGGGLDDASCEDMGEGILDPLDDGEDIGVGGGGGVAVMGSGGGGGGGSGSSSRGGGGLGGGGGGGGDVEEGGRSGPDVATTPPTVQDQGRWRYR